MAASASWGRSVALLVVGVAVASVSRALRASRSAGGMPWGQNDMDEVETYAGRGYLYKVQLALGRSARGIQDRLAAFAAQGDTHSEAGLAALLQQTSLELLREKDAIRYASSEARGPMSLTNAETAMNGCRWPSVPASRSSGCGARTAGCSSPPPRRRRGEKRSS